MDGGRDCYCYLVEEGAGCECILVEMVDCTFVEKTKNIILGVLLLVGILKGHFEEFWLEGQETFAMDLVGSVSLHAFMFTSCALSLCTSNMESGLQYPRLTTRGPARYVVPFDQTMKTPGALLGVCRK